MQTKRNKPLVVTDDQQKAWDLITNHWGKIASFLGVLISISFSVGRYVGYISENSQINEITLNCTKQIDEMRKIEAENCKESLKNYKELVDKIIPIKDGENEK